MSVPNHTSKINKNDNIYKKECDIRINDTLLTTQAEDTRAYPSNGISKLQHTENTN